MKNNKLDILSAFVLTLILSLPFVLPLAMEHRIDLAKSNGYKLFSDYSSKTNRGSCQKTNVQNVIKTTADATLSEYAAYIDYGMPTGAYFIDDPEVWDMVD